MHDGQVSSFNGAHLTKLEFCPQSMVWRSEAYESRLGLVTILVSKLFNAFYFAELREQLVDCFLSIGEREPLHEEVALLL